MLDISEFEKISRIFPFLQSESPQLIRDFKELSYYVKIPAGRDIFIEGDTVDGIALLISGIVRVYKLGQTGREITLYRFGEGESCVITANAILHQQEFPAIAVVEEDAEAVMIPSDAFGEWVRRYDAWRDFVFNLFSQRLVNVMEIVDEVVFQRMDYRLAIFLVKRSKGETNIKITHQAIANEIGSSREVISRLLEDFAKREIILLSRGDIKVLDFEALNSYSLL